MLGILSKEGHTSESRRRLGLGQLCVAPACMQDHTTLDRTVIQAAGLPTRRQSIKPGHPPAFGRCELELDPESTHTPTRPFEYAHSTYSPISSPLLRITGQHRPFHCDIPTRPATRLHYCPLPNSLFYPHRGHARRTKETSTPALRRPGCVMAIACRTTSANPHHVCRGC